MAGQRLVRIAVLAVLLLATTAAQRAEASHHDYACQRASDLFFINAWNYWGIAPADIQEWWTANRCDTTEADLPDAVWCQRASDAYGIIAWETWGYAPAAIQDEWIASGCDTEPRPELSECQRYSNELGITTNVGWGFAPPAIQDRWIELSCNTSPQ